MNKTKIYFNKPIYLDQNILHISKTLMYDFHYNYILKKYPKKAKLLITDTDSLMYEIKTKDFYEDMCLYLSGKFNTLNYPEDHIYPSDKKVPGMFKDETNGKNITEFVGLRSKLYSYRIDDGVEPSKIKKCKGIKKM